MSNTNISSNGVWRSHDGSEQYEYFEQPECGRGMIGVSNTNISSNGVWKRHDWSEQYEYFEQRGVE
ncbi:hypothetical protein [Cohnella abietis]|uniref:hypothetical protein n=1 Tax=Cohnella abietis TaxID=2507935 RepID=UPI00102E9254|nr:hypothetical protein [Cohnella abietis]